MSFVSFTFLSIVFWKYVILDPLDKGSDQYRESPYCTLNVQQSLHFVEVEMEPYMREMKDEDYEYKA